MPTGYTADVADGKVTDFRTFALRCARAFGATIMQRDDPMDESPKHRKPTDYYSKELRKERKELAVVERMTADEADRAAQKAYDDDLARRIEYRAEKAEKRARYEAMLDKARQWKPPTEKHVEMKNFMLRQLTESTDFDCGGDFWQDDPRRVSGAEWKRNRIRELRDSIARHEQYHAEELERCEGANAWIDALYESLDGVPA